MPDLKLNHSHIHYETNGSGPAVILSPGLAGLRGFWTNLVAPLSKSRTVVLYDHRGCGQSGPSGSAVSVEEMAEDVLALADHLGCDRFDLLGHSTGGALGQVLAATHPDRLASLILSSSWDYCDPYWQLLFSTRKTVLRDLGAGPYKALGALFLYPPEHLVQHSDALTAQSAPMSKTQVATVLARLDALLRFDGRPYLDHINCPTLVLCAEDDALTPVYYSRRLHAAINGAHLALLPGGGHSAALVQPEPYVRTVTQFLDQQRKPAGGGP